MICRKLGFTLKAVDREDVRHEDWLRCKIEALQVIGQWAARHKKARIRNWTKAQVQLILGSVPEELASRLIGRSTSDS